MKWTESALEVAADLGVGLFLAVRGAFGRTALPPPPSAPTPTNETPKEVYMDEDSELACGATLQGENCHHECVRRDFHDGQSMSIRSFHVCACGDTWSEGGGTSASTGEVLVGSFGVAPEPLPPAPVTFSWHETMGGVRTLTGLTDVGFTATHILLYNGEEIVLAILASRVSYLWSGTPEQRPVWP